VAELSRILIVRMSALGDIVHALPVLSALRRHYPDATIDWLADRKYAGVLDLVDGLDRVIIGRPGLLRAVGELRARAYDVAVDLQGLLKSAAMTRFSGARRVVGFEAGALREGAAGWFYGETASVPSGAHIIRQNLSVLPALGVSEPPQIAFPFRVPASAAADTVWTAAATRGDGRFALINPGAGWPNKRWAPDRFGAIAQHLRDRHQLPSFVLWGPGEAALADAVVAASDGAAARAPQTSLGDLLALASRAALMIAGDTGPIHLAAALGTPIVGLYGPTWPERNGPWDPNDEIVSRASTCECHHKRQCQRGEPRMCINEIAVADVAAAIDRRLIRGRTV
jgi:lipopolysaccharide heptosyltransferase I